MYKWEVCFLVGGHRKIYYVTAGSQSEAIKEAQRISGISQGSLYAKRV